MPAQFPHALAHSGEPHACADPIADESIENFRRNPLARILDDEDHGPILHLAADRGVRAAGMAVNVREAFLENAEERQLEFGGQPVGELYVDVDFDVTGMGGAAAPDKMAPKSGQGMPGMKM